jgi:hypothetical protein
VASYIYFMPSKPMELPPAVARRFLEDMRAFFAQESPIKRYEIAGRQMSVSSTAGKAGAHSRHQRVVPADEGSLISPENELVQGCSSGVRGGLREWGRDAR